eukprot:TRINITY_DN19831_c0_g1_i1.p1 TRINITY_DN19831_c0_g1~~TRINITY_DN19831_c0_g1_i1.p1  ORF type:complete len:113 (-),score=16.15 TRINITY_DN19831_c0_g1_i1:394-699(-)
MNVERMLCGRPSVERVVAQLHERGAVEAKVSRVMEEVDTWCVELPDQDATIFLGPHETRIECKSEKVRALLKGMVLSAIPTEANPTWLLDSASHNKSDTKT